MERAHTGEMNGEMIVLAREARGWSQQELAARIGMSATNLSKIERGAIGAGAGLLEALARATAFPPQFFLQPGGILPEPGGYRQRVTVAQKLLTPIHARANILQRHIGFLTGALDLPVPQLPSFGADVPERAARQLRARWQLPAGPLRNVARILEEQGIALMDFDFGTERVDSRCGRTASGYPVLLLNTRQGGDRQRFSMAFGLGRLLLQGGEDVDHAAKSFAAEWLMPASDIAAEFGDGITIARLSALKVRWGVSMIALLYRAYDLGFLSPNQKRYLLQQFNELHIRRREPPELDVPYEAPALVKRWLATYRAKTGLNLIETAAVLCLEPEDFIELYG